MRTLLAATAAILLAVPAVAQDKPKPIAAHEKVDQEKVDAAIQSGCKFLLSTGAFSVFPHGKRNQPEAMQAHAELVLLTCAHSGYYKDGDAPLQALTAFVLGKQIGSTYTASLMAMALQKLDAKKYQQRILQCAQFLCDNQCENGQWDYGEPAPIEPPKDNIPTGGPKKPSRDDVATNPADPNAPPSTPGASGDKPAEAEKKPARGGTTAEKKGGKTTSIPRIPVRKRKPGPPNGDNSNTQYAALGVRACLDAGIDMDPRVLQQARKWWLGSQNSDGGWGYNDHGNIGGGDTNETGVSNNSYGSMTVGGVGALCIYDYYMGIQYKTDPAVLKGIEWIVKNYDVTKNPNKTGFAILYYLYGLERAGILFGTERFGAHEWYPEGANHLLSTQNPGGWWTAGDRLPGAPTTDTCFAVLFLRRGTMPLKPVATNSVGDPARPGVPQGGAPVAQPGGGNKDSGLVAGKGIEAVAAGWRLLNSPSSFQKQGEVRGRANVLSTTPQNLNSPPTLRRTVEVRSGMSLKASVGHDERGGWNLVIRVDGKEVHTQQVSAQSSNAGWVEVEFNLAPFAGKTVVIEVSAEGAHTSHWSEVRFAG